MNTNQLVQAKILIVDDDPVNLKLLVDELQAKGHKVLVASQGSRVVRLVEKTQPNLVLLNIMMPNMDGIEVCRRLKANPVAQYVPIILITALNDPIAEMEGLQAGAVDYIPKPIQIQTALARINNHLALQRVHKELEAQNRQLQQQVIERQQVETLLMQRNRELDALNQVGRTFGASLDIETVLKRVLNELQAFFKSTSISFWLRLHETDELVCRYAVGPRSEVVLGWRIAVNQGFTGLVVETNTSLIVANMPADERYFREVDDAIGVEHRSYLGVPLRVQGKVIGVLNLLDTSVGRFKDEDLALLEPLAVSAAIAIENAHLYSAVQSELSQRIHAETKLKTLNTDLEARVDERTKALRYEIQGHLRTESTLKQRQKELVALYNIATIISQPHQLEELLLVTLEKVLEIVRSECLPNILNVDLEVALIAGYIFLLATEDQPSRIFHKGLSDDVTGLLSQAQRESSQIKAGRPKPQKGEEPATPKASLTPDRCLQALQRAGWQVIIDIPLASEVTSVGQLTIFIDKAQADRCKLKNTLPEQLVRTLFAIGQQIGVSIEKKRLEQAATQARVMQEMHLLRAELIDNVSHELRTPLGLIKAISTTLLAEDIDIEPATQVMFLKSINEETEKLEALVNNLLNLSHIKQKGLILNLKKTDLAQLTRKVVQIIRLQQPDFTITCEFPAQFTAVVDPFQIEQVLLNLLSNAIKYSPHCNLLQVTGQIHKDYCRIAIQDNGIGISFEEQTKIFERFYRVRNQTTLAVRGTGLGLPICQEIVAAHKGEIWLQSQPNVGSTFYFTVPK